jgi:hypothetical protein
MKELYRVEVSEEKLAQLRMVLTAFPFPLPDEVRAIVDKLPYAGGVVLALLKPE